MKLCSCRMAFWSACLLLSSVLSTVWAQAPANEYRGFWVDAFGNGFKTASQVTTLINDIRDAKANMIVPEIRKRGDAYYSGSIYEPKPTDISASFDPLQDMINKAHDTSNGKQRIEVHAWIVSYKIWGSQSTLPPASNPPHPYVAHPEWLTQDVTGATWDGSSYTFDPGHPDVQRYTYNVCMDIISRYDVDGFNFDYIRFTGPTWGYHPVTVQRFNTRFGRTGTPEPEDPLWKQFRRDQVSALVRKVYLNAIALKPNVKISADTITWGTSGVANLSQWWGSSAYSSVLQDWRGWMEEGILDLNIPMNYYREHLHAPAYVNWMNFAKDHKYDRHVVIGPGIYLNYTSNAVSQMRATRTASPNGNFAQGVCGYVYKQPDNQGTTFNTFKAYLTSSPNPVDPLSTPIFQNTVPVPPMPWKSSPTKGHLKGFIYSGTLSTNIDGAVVTLSGPVTRSQTNDATGFYGFVDLPPGTYTVTASFPGYAAGSTNITISAGVVSTRDLTLGINGPPAIVADPQSTSAYVGATCSFAVSASGVQPLSYQWRHAGTNLPGATTSALTINPVATNHAGSYQAIVSNPYGSRTSAVATLTVIVPAPHVRLLPRWQLPPGSRGYLTTGATERGLAYNPISHRLLLASRAGTPAIYVLDSANGEELHTLNLGAGLVSGGTYAINLVGAAEDGAVYVCNLVTDSSASNLRIYRWANDAEGTAPTLAYSGNPFSFGQRLGDTLDVRGSGAGTQLLLATRNGTDVVLFTTSNGTSFTPQTIAVASVPGGAFGLGLAFGPGNTFWGKATGQPLRKVSFDQSSGLGTVEQANGSPAVPNSLAPIAFSAALNAIAGASITSTEWDSLQLFDPIGSTMNLVETNGFPTDNSNPNFTGAVDFSSNRVFALNTGNGIVAMEVLPAVTAPTISEPPQSLTLLEGEDAFFTVTATGTAPLTYQWRLGNNTIAGANGSTYLRPNVQESDAGNYSVIVSNSAGSVTSSPALLVVTMPPNVTEHPEDLVVKQNESALFSVSASGSSPMTYQWRKDGTNLSGATQATYNISSAQPGDAGAYQVVISNMAGTVVSAEAILRVQVAPSITAHPQNVTAKAWAEVQFGVSASGEPAPAYFWKHNGQTIPGANSSALSLTDIRDSDAGSYSVLVSNAVAAVMSDTAVLTVLPITPPRITNVAAQASATLVAGSGDPGTIAVEHSTNLLEWTSGASLPSSDGKFQWLDQATNSLKFYRARWSP